MWNTLRSFNTARFSVALQWRFKDNADLSWCDSATLAGLHDGRYSAYCFRVVVLCDGREIGADYLSESIYENPGEFAREHYGIVAKGRDAGVTYCVYFPDMLRSAIAEARKAICDAPKLRCA